MKLLLAIILGVLLIGLVPLARAAITNSSRVIPYQGRLTDSSGNNVADGTYSMTFKIYTVSTGGSASFTETNSSVSVSSGLFSVLLGSLSANGVNLDFANPPYYLGITVGANAEMSPRIQLGFAPLAHNSQYLDGTPLSSFQLNTGVFSGAAGTNTRLQATGTSTGSTGNGSIYFLNSSGVTSARLDTGSDSIGSGADGAVTFTSNTNINTTNTISGRSCADGGDAVNYTVSSGATSGSTSLTLSSSPSTGCLSANDSVLIITLQSSTAADVGKYEMATISSVSGSVVTLVAGIGLSYSGDIMLQRIPNYSNVTINTGVTVTPSAWNGTKGGVVALRASGTLTISGTGSISVQGKGYQNGSIGGTCSTGYQGESTSGNTQSQSQSSMSVGGGGGGAENCGVTWGSGGAGGSNATAGSNGSVDGYQGAMPGGSAGSTYGSTTYLTMGSGGGAGGNSSGAGGAGAGASGGGIILIGANTISLTGTLNANGNTGSSSSNYAGGGGGGAGGSIRVFSNSSFSMGSNLLTAVGGSGGSGSNGGSGGTGGNGYIRVISNSISGTSNPTATTSGLGGILFLSSTNTSSADLAEYYVTGDKSLEAGDVVTINANPNDQIPSSKGLLYKASKPYDSKLVGVISTNPGVVLGSIDGDTGKSDKRQLALAGRVPVKIDPDSEPINVGDFLTSSSKPGYAKKATESGYVIGKALENWNGQDKIEVFINLIYSSPEEKIKSLEQRIKRLEDLLK